MKKSYVVTLIIVAVVAVLAVGAYVYYGGSNSNYTPYSSESSTPPTANTESAGTIVFSDSGFSPASVTVKAGSTVMLKNTSTSTVEMASDPHPVHTDNTDLNLGTLTPGQSKTFTVNKKGTFGYHNHLNSSQTGKITVE